MDFMHLLLYTSAQVYFVLDTLLCDPALRGTHERLLCSLALLYYITGAFAKRFPAGQQMAHEAQQVAAADKEHEIELPKARGGAWQRHG